MQGFPQRMLARHHEVRPGNLYKPSLVTGILESIIPTHMAGMLRYVCLKNDTNTNTIDFSCVGCNSPTKMSHVGVPSLKASKKNTTLFRRISMFNLATSTDTCVVRKDVGLKRSSWHPLQKTKYIRPQLSQMRIFTKNSLKFTMSWKSMGTFRALLRPYFKGWVAFRGYP